jgi:hypothetical protein
MVSFGSAAPANLTGLRIGWNGDDNATGSYTDSDISVYYWAAGGTPVIGTSPTSSFTGTGLSSGWKLVGDYMEVGSANSNSVTFTGNAATNTTNYNSNTFSSYWLVSAYTGGSNDAFKLSALKGNVCIGTQCPGGTNNQTPEPGSLALVGVAVLGMAAVRRRRVQAS